MAEIVRTTTDGPRFTVTLNRPEVHNALNAELIDALARVFRDVAGRHDVRYVVIASEGPSFCAGGDLTVMRDMIDRPHADNLRVAGALPALLEAMITCPKPIIARVHGATFAGGMGLVAACDLAVAHPKAVFGLTEVRLGIVPAMIFPYLLRRVARHELLWATLTGDRFPAARALAMGLVNEVTGDLDGVIHRWAESVLAGGPNALAGAKELFFRVPQMSWDAARALTVELIVRNCISPEGQEGMLAFLEKRRPIWPTAG
ncbi:MAG: enoyl-CoA hydratase-related protein [Armatimonadota bacterium]|nr:enoyl-CoA hydratase-related protein [Armatimonadota bacterium]